MDHWKAAKKVMRYLQGTKDYMLMYRRANYLEVTGYLDVDFVDYVHGLEKVHFWIYIHASWWSCILEERKVDWFTETKGCVPCRWIESQFDQH